jgi:hypothetical protein
VKEGDERRKSTRNTLKGKEPVGLTADAPIRADGLASKVEYRFDLLPPESLMAAAQVMHEGAQKGYTAGGWRQIHSHDHINHAMGHIIAHLDGYDEGPDGEDHLSHAMVRLMFAWATRGCLERTQ